MTDIADRIQLGVLYLDETQPGWQDKIDILKLDINLFSSCILGQLNPPSTGSTSCFAAMDSYGRATWKLHDWMEEHGLETDNVAYRAGFDTPLGESTQELTRAWVEVLGR